MPNLASLQRQYGTRQVTDFSGGLNTLPEEHLIAENQAIILDNLVTVTGGLRTRPAAGSALTTLQAGKNVLGFGFFKHSNGTRYLVGVANNSGDTAAKLQVGTWDGTTVGALTTLTLTGGGALNFTAGLYVTMVQYGNVVYFCNGTDNVHKHTLGTTVADPITVPTAPTTAPTIVQANNAFNTLSTNTGGVQSWVASSSTDFGESTAAAMVDTAEGSVICKVKATTIAADVYITRQETAARNVDRSRYIVIQGVSDVAGRQLWVQFGQDSGGTASWQDDLQFPMFFETANQWKVFAFDLGTKPETIRQSVQWVRFIRKFSNLKSESAAVTFRFKGLNHSGGLWGEYEYTYTYYNSTTGQESAFPRDSSNNLILTKQAFALSANGADLSASITVTGTALSGGEPAKIRVYRRGGSHTDFYRVNQVANPGASTTTTADPWPDTWLGRSSGNGNFTDGTTANLVIFTAANNAAPPVASAMALRNDRMWYNDTANITRAYLSDITNPDNVPRVNIFDDGASNAEGGFFEVGKDNREALVAFAPGERMTFLKDKSAWYTDADNMREVLIQGGAKELSGQTGIRSKRAVCFGHYGFFFLSHDGWMWCDGRTPPVPVSEAVANRFLPIDPTSGGTGGRTAVVADLQNAHAVYSQGRGLLFFKNTGVLDSGDQSRALVYDTRRVAAQPLGGVWSEWVFRDASALAQYVTASATDRQSGGAEKVYIGCGDGRIYLLDDSKNSRDRWAGGDAGIAWKYRSKLIDFASLHTRIVAFRLLGDFGSTAETVTVKILDAAGTVLNGGGSGSTITAQNAGDQDVVVFDNSVRARQGYVELSGTRPSTADQDFVIRGWQWWPMVARGQTI